MGVDRMWQLSSPGMFIDIFILILTFLLSLYTSQMGGNHIDGDDDTHLLALINKSN